MKERLEEIQKRLDAATKWPWTLEKGFICSGGYEQGVSVAVMIARLDTDLAAGDDGPLIANAPADIDYLLSAVRDLQEENARLRAELEQYGAVVAWFDPVGTAKHHAEQHAATRMRDKCVEVVRARAWGFRSNLTEDRDPRHDELVALADALEKVELNDE
jgi:hypothetical protein